MISHITLGKEKIETAAREMAGIRQLVENYASDSPLQSKSLLVCVTPTPQTGVLLMALRDLGAVVAACADNQYASDDDVVSFLKSEGIAIFAKSNMSSRSTTLLWITLLMRLQDKTTFKLLMMGATSQGIS
jgi:S-adenosylhomocysteine hydrolase